MIKIFLILVFFSSTVFADEWKTADTYREGTYLILNLIEYGQSSYIVQHPDQFYQTSNAWALGKHPDQGRVNVYYGIVMIAHPVIAYYMSDSVRKAFQYFTIGGKITGISDSFTVGVEVPIK